VTSLYYKSRKRELKTRPINECRYDVRLKFKSEESTRQRIDFCESVVLNHFAIKAFYNNFALRGTINWIHLIVP
jgi:hypothetical protein